MRIGIFTECYRPTMNGVVVSIDTFKQSLEKRGHEYFIFAPETHDFKDTEKNIFRYPSVSMPGQSYYPLALPALAPWITEKTKELGLDIIHSQHMFTMGKAGMQVARELGIPFVYTYHTLIAEYTHYVPFVQSIVRKVIINRSRQFCNQCDHVITPSHSMKRVLHSYGVKREISVIPTGIEPDSFKRIDPRPVKAKYHIPEEDRILLFVGRLAEEKNILFLLKAFKKLLEEEKNIHLVLVGGGPSEEDYKNFVKKNMLGRYITFTGYLEKQETNRVFGASDLFVFPSITDTQGIVVVEAMASGAPVVAIDKLGPSDIVSNGVDGYLTTLTYREFNDKIKYLLADKKRWEKFSHAARKNALNYSTELSATKMENLYKRLVGEKSERSNTIWQPGTPGEVN